LAILKFEFAFCLKRNSLGTWWRLQEKEEEREQYLEKHCHEEEGLWKGVAKGKERVLNYILKTTTIKGERE
jgi:hypothetical protein